MESYWDSLVEATGNSYESGAGVEYDDLPACDEPLFLLGHPYSTKHDRDDIRLDHLSRLWMTYRRDFPPIGGSEGPRTDRGWGCMLRCGQMVLAEAILRVKLGRAWRWRPGESYGAPDGTYRAILRLFEDTKAAPFSIHQIASMGVSDGKTIGQWFGPNTVAQAIKKLSVFDRFANILVHVALDNTIIIDDLKTLIRTAPSSPLLLFVPLRLGLSELNQQYVPALKRCLELPQTLGIIGGKPNHAHYFVGYQGGDLYYLDPHTTQDCVAMGDHQAGAAAASGSGGGAHPDATYHCASVRRMPFGRLDPSLALAFVCASEVQLDELCASLVRQLVQKFDLPLFEVHQSRPAHWPPFEPYTLAGQMPFDKEEDNEDDNYVLL